MVVGILSVVSACYDDTTAQELVLRTATNVPPGRSDFIDLAALKRVTYFCRPGLVSGRFPLFSLSVVPGYSCLTQPAIALPGPPWAWQALVAAFRYTPGFPRLLQWTHRPSQAIVRAAGG